MPTTQKAIALELGVSRTLVTMALQDNPSINFLTRERVKATAARLGYNEHSNREARVLIGKRYGKRPRTGILAVFMPKTLFAGVALPSVPFFQPFIRGVEVAAMERELDVFLCSLHNERLPRLVSDGNVDGVICLTSPTVEIEQLDVPVVLFGQEKPWAHSLVADEMRAMALAVEHLAQLGHRRIAYLGFEPLQEYSASWRRLEAFRAAMAAQGLVVDEELVEASLLLPRVESGQEGMARLLARRRDFTGLVCFNDLMAMGAIRRAEDAGFKVPGDLSVVGFDDVCESYDFQPALTSIYFDREAMGQRAVKLVDERLAESDGADKTDKKSCERFPVELKIRSTTASAAPII